MSAKKISDGFHWVGSLDPDLRVFDIVMETQFGTTYNSYILKGSEKTALFEASKAKFFDSYKKNVEEVCPIESIDYLVVDHTEPDHSGVIAKLLEINPGLEIIGSMGALNFLGEITNEKVNGRAVKTGDSLDLGGVTVEFITAPNLHWPDTIFSYVPEKKILLTCDAFGSHYSDPNITDDSLKSREDYLGALEYYFTNIIGPFKKDMLAAIEKIKGLDIEVLATGHGPVVTSHVAEVIEKYRSLSQALVDNPNDRQTVVIPYVSSYGYTEALAKKIAEGIAEENAEVDLRLHDMVYDSFDEVMGEIYWADGFLFGTPTIAGEALPNIWKIATALNKHVHGGKLAAVFGSYGWSGEGVPNILQRLKQVSLKIYDEKGFRVRFKPSEAELDAAKEFGRGFATELPAR
jgi:flavorubredoxin